MDRQEKEKSNRDDDREREDKQNRDKGKKETKENFENADRSKEETKQKQQEGFKEPIDGEKEKTFDIEEEK